MSLDKLIFLNKQSFYSCPQLLHFCCWKLKLFWQVEWSGGPETMEEILNRIHYRETAAAKRERTMAYAFSHQASTTQIFFSF